MMNIRLTKQFDFEAAHALEGYSGKCRDIHGHTYHLDVTVIGNIDYESGKLDGSMVLDFSELKKIVKKNIVDFFDHKLILSKDSKFAYLEKENPRTMLVNYVPTCENILIDIVKKLQNKLPDHIELFKVMLRETPRSYAEWFKEDN